MPRKKQKGSKGNLSLTIEEQKFINKGGAALRMLQNANALDKDALVANMMAKEEKKRKADEKLRNARALDISELTFERYMYQRSGSKVSHLMQRRKNVEEEDVPRIGLVKEIRIQLYRLGVIDEMDFGTNEGGRVNYKIEIKEPVGTSRTKMKRAVDAVRRELCGKSFVTPRVAMELLLENLHGMFADNVPSEAQRALSESRQARIKEGNERLLAMFDQEPLPWIKPPMRIVGEAKVGDPLGKIDFVGLERLNERVEKEISQRELAESCKKVRELAGESFIDNMNVTLNGGNVNLVHNSFSPGDDVEDISDAEYKRQLQKAMSSAHDCSIALLPVFQLLPKGLITKANELMDDMKRNVSKRARAEKEFSRAALGQFAHLSNPTEAPVNHDPEEEALPAIPFLCTWCKIEVDGELPLKGHFKSSPTCKAKLDSILSSRLPTMTANASQMRALDGVKLWRQGLTLDGNIVAPPAVLWGALKKSKRIANRCEKANEAFNSNKPGFLHEKLSAYNR